MVNKGSVRDYGLTDGSTLQYAFRKSAKENDVQISSAPQQKPLVSDLQDPRSISSQPFKTYDDVTQEVDEIEKA